MKEDNAQATLYRRTVVMDIETIALEPTCAKGALDALTGRIVCIGLLFDDGKNTTEATIIDPDETLLLERFWASLLSTDVLVGHNILEFDLPFAKQRSWILGVRPTRSLDMRKYYTGDVADTMQMWTNWGFKKGVSLDVLGQALGVGRKTGQGADVAQWWALRDFQSIGTYCLDDVRLTYRVYRRLTYQPLANNALSAAVGSAA